MNKIVHPSEKRSARRVDLEPCPHRQKEAMRKALRDLSRKRTPQAAGRKLRLPAVRHG